MEYDIDLVIESDFSFESYIELKLKYEGESDNSSFIMRNEIGVVAVASDPNGRRYGEASAVSVLGRRENGDQVLDKSPVGSHNVIWLSKEHFGAKNSKISGINPPSKTEVAVHGAGHTMARKHIHNDPNYQYNQVGLQSNEGGKIYPTRENTLNIINDENNRATIKDDN